VSYRHSRVSSRLRASYHYLAAVALIDSIVGCPLCRSPLSIDLVTQPSLAPASGETVISAPDPSCN
jgi:hypothetical protein